MNKAPAFQFYAQDFLTGTMYLTNEEIGIYIKMLAKQWTDEKIPKKRLGFLVGYDWENLSDELKSKFEDKGEYVVNKRLEKERDRKERFIERQRENGKKGGRPPKSKNPTKSQKKPLEHEHEKEDEKEVLKNKGLIDKKTEKKLKEPPTLEEFLEYAIREKPNVDEESVKLKYKSWIANGWQTNGKTPKPIKNWKSTLLNTLPHLKETDKTKQNEPTINRQTADTIRKNLTGW